MQEMMRASSDSPDPPTALTLTAICEILVSVPPQAALPPYILQGEREGWQ